MIGKKDSWADLTSLWQEDQGLDPETLSKAVKRKTWSMRAMTAIEVLVGTVGVGFGFWMINRGQDTFQTGLGVFIVLFSIIGTAFTVLTRKGTWAASETGISGQVHLTLRRARAGVKLAIVNLWGLVPACAMILSILFYRWEVIVTASPGKQQELILIFTIGGLALGLTAVWALWYKALKRREIARLKTLLKELEDQE